MSSDEDASPDIDLGTLPTLQRSIDNASPERQNHEQEINMNVLERIATTHGMHTLQYGH